MPTTQMQKTFTPMCEAQKIEVIEALLRTYRQNTHRPNSDRIGKEDSLNVSISAEILDHMSAAILVNEAKGVRAYFGRYPDDYSNPELAGRQSLVYALGVLKYSPNRFIAPENVIAFGSTSRIEKKIVDTLLTTYRQITHKINSERIGKEDTSSVFLSIELLDQMRTEVSLRGEKGARIYFGRYPKDFPNSDLASRQTIILTVGELGFSADGFTVPKNVFAFYDVPICPSLCMCGEPGYPPC